MVGTISGPIPDSSGLTVTVSWLITRKKSSTSNVNMAVSTTFYLPPGAVFRQMGVTGLLPSMVWGLRIGSSHNAEIATTLSKRILIPISVGPMEEAGPGPTTSCISMYWIPTMSKARNCSRLYVNAMQGIKEHVFLSEV